MRALDVLDLSHTLEESTHKQAFLDQIHRITTDRYVWKHHRLNEQRGMLTNVVHNAVVRHLSERHGLIPVAFYPEGVAYLAKADALPEMGAEERNALSRAVADAVAKGPRRDFVQFIRPTSSGIVVAPECWQLGIRFAEIWKRIYNIVAAKAAQKRFKPDEQEGKIRRALEAARDRGDQGPAVAELLACPTLVPRSQEGMAAAELLRSYYILLNDYRRAEMADPWAHIYSLLGREESEDKGVRTLDARYLRAYAVAQRAGLTLDPLYALLGADGAKLFATVREDEQDIGLQGDFGEVVAYADSVIVLDFGEQPKRDFTLALHRYTENQHRQCCYCGSEFPTDRWMAAQVPKNILVQSFSNRLPGGSSAEPKRFVCSVCRMQFTLEKLARRASDKTSTVYLFLYPRSYYPGAYLQAIRQQVDGLVAEDVTVIFPEADASIQAFVDDHRLDLRVRVSDRSGKPYQNGLALPQYTETIGNTMVFPLNCPGDTQGERFLFALQNALLMQRYFGCRALLSRTPTPPVGSSEVRDLFVDGIPLSCSGLVPEADMDQAMAERLWQDVILLHRIRRLLFNPERQRDVQLELVRAMSSDSRWGVFFTVDRLIEAKVSQRKGPGSPAATGVPGLNHHLAPLVRELVKEGKAMKSLEHLAELAWEGHIRGRNLERNSLIKPFDMVLDALEERSAAFGEDTLRAQLVEDIFRHLEVITPDAYRVGRTKREKVKAFVAQFFDGVLRDVYGGSIPRLLSDKRHLRSAYLFYLREQIPSGEAATSEG